MHCWCCLSDSNRPPSGYKADALPDELKQHNTGGEGGTRTPDLIRMKDLFFQLNYITMIKLLILLDNWFYTESHVENY